MYYIKLKNLTGNTKAINRSKKNKIHRMNKTLKLVLTVLFFCNLNHTKSFFK